MRLWRLGKTKSLAEIKYAGFDSTHDAEIIHLYRGLLRQCTYLPDSAARQFLHGHIVSRFRDYHPRTIFPAPNRAKRSVPLVEQRRPALLRTAPRGLVFLQRANDGHPKHLGKILAMAYGRVGKRRHELLEPLLVPDTPMDQAAVEKMSDPASKGLPHPSGQFQALIKAQAKKKQTFFSRNGRPTLEPQIPTTNAWGRHTPIKRIRNLKKRWYAETIDKIMPPLPESEWKRLRGLASGEIQWEGPVRRRESVEVKGLNTGTFRGTMTGGAKFVSSPHELTPRYMKRLWAKIFAQCPLMERNEFRKSGWDIRWGDVNFTRDLALHPEKQASMAMFEGVDERGKVLQSGKSAG